LGPGSGIPLGAGVPLVAAGAAALRFCAVSFGVLPGPAAGELARVEARCEGRAAGSTVFASTRGRDWGLEGDTSRFFPDSGGCGREAAATSAVCWPQALHFIRFPSRSSRTEYRWPQCSHSTAVATAHSRMRLLFAELDYNARLLNY